MKDSYNQPFITVFIGAYNRKDYLIKAVNSVLNQTVDKNLYEVIVSKNFIDDKIDKYLEENGCRIIFFERGLVGEQIVSGVKEAKGKIIAFLDDDDLFLPNKLERIYDVFSKNDEIVYYHNEQLIATEDGKILNKKYSVTTKKYSSDQFFNMDHTKLNNAIFNLSSIVIRKDYYLKYLNILKNMPSHPDDFFFFAALNEKTHIFIDQLPLTIYLRYNNSLSYASIPSNNDTFSLKKYIENRSSIFSKYYKSNEKMYHAFTNPKLLKIIEFRLYREYIEYCYYSNVKLKKRNIKYYLKLIIRILKIKDSLKYKFLVFVGSTFMFIFSFNQFKSLTLEKLITEAENIYIT
jgi:glycosyltransferase involved in cell wall biosynthesis